MDRAASRVVIEWKLEVSIGGDSIGVDAGRADPLSEWKDICRGSR